MRWPILDQGGWRRGGRLSEGGTGNGRKVFGVGVDTDVATASIRAVLSAANGRISCRRDKGRHHHLAMIAMMVMAVMAAGVWANLNAALPLRQRARPL
ncbi:hypothetical protein [Azospirillum sp. B4]|uniref:hypothetical protein n=1 Tax=Azospirillum sp. B4 TaxID=95605 RepID=UPI00034D50A3|nr:hypothetical protein [Azospirillum sp. B4]